MSREKSSDYTALQMQPRLFPCYELSFDTSHAKVGLLGVIKN